MKLVTPANLSAILRSGGVKDDASRIEFTGMPILANLDIRNLKDTIGNVHFIKPVEFELSLGAGRCDGQYQHAFRGFRLEAIKYSLAANRRCESGSTIAGTIGIARYQ